MGIEDKIREQLKDVKQMRDIAIKLRNRKFTGRLWVEWREGRILEWGVINLPEEEE